jgi:glycosyltransferase involved in cell wall biosynthesis
MLALQRKTFLGRLLFVAVGISLWVPTWRIENYTVAAMAKVSVWVLGLGYVLYHARAFDRLAHDPRSVESKSPPFPSDGSGLNSSGLDSATIDIVVPVLNESASVEEFYARVARLGLGKSLVFVDNASTDDTVQKIQRMPGVRLVRHATNEGYGASLRDGMLAGTAPRIVIIDADLEYPPESIPAMLTALERETVVYGSRFLGADRPDMPLFRRIGNRVISGVFNLLFHQHTTDFYTGMKALRREALSGIVLHQNGFEHVVELGAKLACEGHTISEIAVAYTPRSRGVSKMKHLPETLKYVWFVTRYWLKLVVLDGRKTASEPR